MGEQRDESTADCEANGWKAAFYEDNDRSASRYARKPRKEWERLLGDLRAGRFGVVWLWETSRGDRKLLEWTQFLEECRGRGVLIHVHTHGRTYDVKGNDADWRALASEGVDNAYASDLTSKRIRRHLDRVAREGHPHGPAGYGYTRRYDPVTRALIAQEKDPATAPVAEEIITRIARSEHLTAIKADLDARGIPGPSGKPWDRQTIRQIGLNPAYAGCRRLADGTLVENAWTPIVGMEVHRAAAAVLRARASKRPSRQKHLLSYLARCGWCDEPRNALRPAFPRGTLTYRCSAHGCVSVSAAWLDELVTTAVCDALAGDDAAALFRADSEQGDLHRIEAAALRAQLDEWLQAGVSARAYAVKEAQILPQIERAERAAAAAEVPLALAALLGADDVRAAWDAQDLTAQRDIIRALMDVKVARPPDRTRAARTDPARVIIAWKHA